MNRDKPPRLGILVGRHGRGTNMANLVEATRDGRLAAQVGVVIGPDGGTPALEWADRLGIPTRIVPVHPQGYGEVLLSVLREHHVQIVCLAGYMRLLPSEVVAAFRDRVLNIHPALLPKFGGKGMYGRHVHEAVLAAGEQESGCTVHYVNERYDEGAIIARCRCDVLPDDTPETLAHRVLQLEHFAYVEAVKIVLERTGLAHAN